MTCCGTPAQVIASREPFRKCVLNKVKLSLNVQQNEPCVILGGEKSSMMEGGKEALNTLKCLIQQLN